MLHAPVDDNPGDINRAACRNHKNVNDLSAFDGAFFVPETQNVMTTRPAALVSTSWCAWAIWSRGSYSLASSSIRKCLIDDSRGGGLLLG